MTMLPLRSALQDRTEFQAKRNFKWFLEYLDNNTNDGLTTSEVEAIASCICLLERLVTRLFGQFLDKELYLLTDFIDCDKFDHTIDIWEKIRTSELLKSCDKSFEVTPEFGQLSIAQLWRDLFMDGEKVTSRELRKRISRMS